MKNSILVFSLIALVAGRVYGLVGTPAPSPSSTPSPGCTKSAIPDNKPILMSYFGTFSQSQVYGVNTLTWDQPDPKCTAGTDPNCTQATRTTTAWYLMLLPPAPPGSGQKGLEIVTKYICDKSNKWQVDSSDVTITVQKDSSSLRPKFTAYRILQVRAHLNELNEPIETHQKFACELNGKISTLGAASGDTFPECGTLSCGIPEIKSPLDSVDISYEEKFNWTKKRGYDDREKEYKGECKFFAPKKRPTPTYAFKQYEIYGWNVKDDLRSTSAVIRDNPIAPHYKHYARMAELDYQGNEIGPDVISRFFFNTQSDYKYNVACRRSWNQVWDCPLNYPAAVLLPDKVFTYKVFGYFTPAGMLYSDCGNHYTKHNERNTINSIAEIEETLATVGKAVVPSYAYPSKCKVTKP